MLNTPKPSQKAEATWNHLIWRLQEGHVHYSSQRSAHFFTSVPRPSDGVRCPELWCWPEWMGRCFFGILEADCLLFDQKFSAFVFQKMYMDDLFPPRPHLTVFPHFINVVNLTIMYLLYSSLLSHDDRWTWPLNEIHKNSFLLKCSCFCIHAP